MTVEVYSREIGLLNIFPYVELKINTTKCLNYPNTRRYYEPMSMITDKKINDDGTEWLAVMLQGRNEQERGKSSSYGLLKAGRSYNKF